MLLKILRRFLKPHAKLLVGVVVFQLLQSIASLYLPTLNADIIDNGVAKGDTNYIFSTGAMMLGITVLQIACSITAVYFGARVAMGVGRDLRLAVFQRVGEFSEREVTRFGAPSLITRSTNDVQQVQMLVLMTCTMLVSAPILAIGGIILALQQDLQLSWLMAVSVPVLVISIGLVISRMVPQFRQMQKRIDSINRILREQLTGIRVVRAFVREPVEVERFGVANEAVTATAFKVGRLTALLFPIVMFVLNVSSVAVIWFGAERIDYGQMEVGSLIAFLSYFMQILMAVLMVAVILVLLPRAAVCAERITGVISTVPAISSPEHPTRPDTVTGEITLEAATFYHTGADSPVLQDVSLTARPGSVTAIVGSTGSGKSTLISLICRLYDVREGAVRIDGIDVRDYEIEQLWAAIGLVPQRGHLFSGTVADNLRYGKSDATDEEMWEALRIAAADQFVSAHPEGLAMPVSQGGINFSGGQRQRLAIARAVIRRPAIYLFDDAFSALDVHTDARVRMALREVSVGATVVIVSQRISTIIEADQIVVIDDGTVVGTGSHESLLTDCPTYAEFADSQSVGAGSGPR
jgi:ATP-binding cassette subfamily B multidrug efflux pump